jgi:hypothetical protein
MRGLILSLIFYSHFILYGHLIFYSQIALAAETLMVEPMGRLFTTPAERSQLDYLRQTSKKAIAPMATEMPIDASGVSIIIPPETAHLQGYVKRHDGKQGTVWVNNQALQENSQNQELAVGSLGKNNQRVPIQLSISGKRVYLKAGQVYDSETDQVREAKNHAAQGDTVSASGTIGE